MPTVSFECTLCTEDRSQQQDAVRTIADNPICDDCVPEVLSLFKDALKNEINYPPRWGPIDISFESFEDLFNDDFRLAYREKVREYTTPIPKRVYCQHKVVSTSMDKSASQAGADFCNTFMGVQVKSVSRCSGCTQWMCMECRDIAVPPLEAHTCDNLNAAIKAESESNAFDAAKRGVEWQECPNPDCKMKCDLRDGCNAMICPCSEHFCFLCGEVADHDSDHWMEGKPCPRWGAVGAEVPMFDRPPGPIPHPGFLVILAPQQDLLGDPVDLQHFDIVFAADDRLFMDSEESLTLLEESASEQFFMEDPSGQIPQTILDMMELLRLWQTNFSWLKIDSALAGADPLVRNMLVDPIKQAIETTNFFIRDEALQAKLRETHAAALEISGEDSVLFTVPVIEIFERYNTVHKPRLVENLQQFVAAREAGRVLRVGEEERFARRMLLRHEQEAEAGEENLPHRRASI